MRKITRIFEVATETASDGKPWTSYRVAARTAEQAIKEARKEFSPALDERLLSVTVLASTN